MFISTVFLHTLLIFYFSWFINLIIIMISSTHTLLIICDQNQWNECFHRKMFFNFHNLQYYQINGPNYISINNAS